MCRDRNKAYWLSAHFTSFHFVISKMPTFSLIIFLTASLVSLQPTGMLSPHHISSSAMIRWAPRRLCTEYVNTHTHMCTCISACVNAYQAFLSLPFPLAITVVLWSTRVTTKEWFRRGHKKNRVEILSQYCLYVCESACTYNYFLLVAFSDLWLKLEKLVNKFFSKTLTPPFHILECTTHCTI